MRVISFFLILLYVGVMRVARILRIESISPNDPGLQNSPDITVVKIQTETVSAAGNVALKLNAYRECVAT